MGHVFYDPLVRNSRRRKSMDRKCVSGCRGTEDGQKELGAGVAAGQLALW